MVDRYTKFVLTVIALALAVLAARPFVEPRPAFSGLTEEQTKEMLSKPQPPKEVSRTWGRFVGTFTLQTGTGMSWRYVTFEATDGTLRTALVCPVCEVVRK